MVEQYSTDILLFFSRVYYQHSSGIVVYSLTTNSVLLVNCC